MISVLLILALARQNLGAGSEQELVQIAGVTGYAQPACASNGPPLHLHASAVTEPHAVKLDAEALARSLPSDNPESSRRYELVITADPETPRGSNPKEGGPPLTSYTDRREPASSHAAGINQRQTEENNHSANPDAKTKQSTSSSSGTSISDSKITGFHRRMNNQIGGKCAICLNRLGTSITPDLQCSHTFHQHCLLGWINSDQGNNFLCPTCRQQMYPKEAVSSGSESFWKHLEQCRKKKSLKHTR